MKLRLLSSLTKVFSDKEPNFLEFTEFSALKNEVFSFQLALFPEEDSETVVSLSLESRLKSRTSIYSVKAMPSRLSHSENHDCFYYEKRSEYPDLLLPIKNRASNVRFRYLHFLLPISSIHRQSLFFRISFPLTLHAFRMVIL